MGKLRSQLREDHAEAAVSIWKEALFGVEALLLHTAPVFYGFGVPHGDSSGVVLIPCFLGTDPQMTHLYHWLRRIGYRPYFSRIGVNAACPNLLVRERLTPTIDKALAATGRKVHLIGHSLGGIMARSIAANRPADIASVITLASPFRGTVAHKSILRAAESVRKQTGTARRSGFTRLLHGTLHLRICQFAAPQDAPFGGGNRNLHAPRRSRGLAILPDRRRRE